MKNIIGGLLFLGISAWVGAQEQGLSLKKGTIIDSIAVGNTAPETFSLYLPTDFDLSKKWPIMLVFDLKGRPKQSLQTLLPAAEKNKYILAASNNITDTLSISDNVLVTSRLINKIVSILPINNRRIYTAGFSDNGKFASLLPVVINNVEGVLAVNSPLANTEVLNTKKTFHYIAIGDVNDYHLVELKENEVFLNSLKYPNQLFVYDKAMQPTMFDYIDKAMETFTINAMAKNSLAKDPEFIKKSYQKNLTQINNLISEAKFLQAFDLASETMEVYRNVLDTEELKDIQKRIRRNRIYKDMKRTEAAYALKESFIQEDLDYAMFEDMANYNFNNLGWWKFQMQELDRKKNPRDSIFERRMNNRLKSFINYLVDDNSKELLAEKVPDEEAIVFLAMLKTITDPTDFGAYQRVISLSAKIEDYETSLFYLEELLKAGFTDKKELYQIENTGLLRISPEFNEIVEKYLNEARYLVPTLE